MVESVSEDSNYSTQRDLVPIHHAMEPISRRRMLALAAGTGGALLIGRSPFVRAEGSELTTRDVVFESNFAADTGYRVQRIGLWNGGSNNPTAPPAGWDGVKATGDSIVSVVDGQGVAGSNALRLEWDPQASQPTVSLGKHLTGNPATGYDEIYIRYNVRMPNSIRFGLSGDRLFYWKWGRLWQNTTTYGDSGQNNWTENRVDSHYVVWNFGGNVPYTDVNAVWGANTGTNLERGSAGGERYAVDYFISGSGRRSAPGYFESIWPFDNNDRPGELINNTTQTWHTLEYRFKLASSPTSNDGEFEMWWDGVAQGPYARIREQGGAAPAAGIPTTRIGSGFNFLTLFDNMAGWNSDWSLPGVDGSLWVNDVVVATSRIGHDYAIGGATQTPSNGLVPTRDLKRAVRIQTSL